MADRDGDFIDVARLRVGHYVYLDLGWMDHPFALNHFRISTEAQIATIRGLGLARVRFSPEKSAFADESAIDSPTIARYATGDARRTYPAAAPPEPDQEEIERAERRAALFAQRERLQRCENQFNDAAQGFRDITDNLVADPGRALARCDEIVTTMLDAMGGPTDESFVRLLSEKAGERTSLHSINVTIVSLLLARALGSSTDELHHIGIGAMLHDLGKMALPERLRWARTELAEAEMQLYRLHVDRGVAVAAGLNLPQAALEIIGQHHERSDGTGFPRGLQGDQISQPAGIVALVNEYDNMANPANPIQALTPHEALASIYAQRRNKFDPRILSVFVRLMGVYPPGSVIELSSGHYAMVVSVNPGRPLRPQVVVHDPAVPPTEALVFNLETAPEIGIRRSLKPIQLPKAAFDYLSPRKRICYYFERASETSPVSAP